MNLYQEYQAKLRTPEEAVQVVKSGDWVDYTSVLCYPPLLDAALAKRRDELTDVKVRGNLLFGPIQKQRIPRLTAARTAASGSPFTSVCIPTENGKWRAISGGSHSSANSHCVRSMQGVELKGNAQTSYCPFFAHRINASCRSGVERSHQSRSPQVTSCVHLKRESSGKCSVRSIKSRALSRARH